MPLALPPAIRRAALDRAKPAQTSVGRTPSRTASSDPHGQALAAATGSRLRMRARPCDRSRPPPPLWSVAAVRARWRQDRIRPAKRYATPVVPSAAPIFVPCCLPAGPQICPLARYTLPVLPRPSPRRHPGHPRQQYAPCPAPPPRHPMSPPPPAYRSTAQPARPETSAAGRDEPRSMTFTAPESDARSCPRSTVPRRARADDREMRARRSSPI